MDVVIDDVCFKFYFRYSRDVCMICYYCWIAQKVIVVWLILIGSDYFMYIIRSNS